MAHEAPLSGSPSAALPDPEDEPVTAEQPPASDAPAEAPFLNRAERRAQAKGKTGPAGTGGPGGGVGSAPRGQGGRAGGHVGQVRFPRTGHK